MTDSGTELPAEEQRGGEHVDWTRAKPGRPLPEQPQEEPPAPAPGQELWPSARSPWPPP